MDTTATLEIAEWAAAEAATLAERLQATVPLATTEVATEIVATLRSRHCASPGQAPVPPPVLVP
jgi:hypothetical protein